MLVLLLNLADLNGVKNFADLMWQEVDVRIPQVFGWWGVIPAEDCRVVYSVRSYPKKVGPVLGLEDQTMFEFWPQSQQFKGRHEDRPYHPADILINGSLSLIVLVWPQEDGNCVIVL